MALTATDLRDQLNGVPEADPFLARLLGAAQAHTERQLGFKLDDTDELPEGPPADLEHAVLMLAAHLYENREALLVGVTAQEVPMGYADTIANHRRYSFGYCEEAGNDDE